MREIPKELGSFPHSMAAWDRRVQSGQAGAGMSNGLNGFGRRRVLEMFADWTDRIAAGEVPAGTAASAWNRAEHRDYPVGLGRSEVVPARFGLDRSAQSAAQSVRTHLRRARAELGLRAGARSCEAHRQPDSADSVRDPNTPPTNPKMPAPSPYWGDEVIWTSKNNVHNPMLDEKNALWLTSAVAPFDNPDFLQGGLDASVGEGVPVNDLEPPPADVRPADARSSRTSGRASRRIT